MAKRKLTATCITLDNKSYKILEKLKKHLGYKNNSEAIRNVLHYMATLPTDWA